MISLWESNLPLHNYRPEANNDGLFHLYGNVHRLNSSKTPHTRTDLLFWDLKMNSTLRRAIFITKEAETPRPLKRNFHADVSGKRTFLFLSSNGQDSGDEKHSLTKTLRLRSGLALTNQKPEHGDGWGWKRPGMEGTCFRHGNETNDWKLDRNGGPRQRCRC